MSVGGDSTERARADLAAEMIISDERDKVAEFFAREEMDPPTFVWNPDPETFPHPLMKHFLATWQQMPHAPDRPIPLAKDFDVFAFRSAIGHMMYLDVIDGGRDFRYRVYGSRIAQFSGFDLTGKNLGKSDAPSISRDFMLACYKALVRRQEPLFTQHKSPRDFLVATWSRILVPLVDESGATTRLLGVNIPSGKEPLNTGVRSVFT
jgi:hypothetical protein